MKEWQPVICICNNTEGSGGSPLHTPIPVLSETSQARHGGTGTDDLTWHLEKVIFPELRWNDGWQAGGEG